MLAWPLLGILILRQRGLSALEVWGILAYDGDQDARVEDEDKEAFMAHVNAIFDESCK